MIHLPAAFSLDEIRCEIFVMDPEFSPAWTTEFLIIKLMMRLSHWRREGSCAWSCRNHAGRTGFRACTDCKWQARFGDSVRPGQGEL